MSLLGENLQEGAPPPGTAQGAVEAQSLQAASASNAASPSKLSLTGLLRFLGH